MIKVLSGQKVSQSLVDRVGGLTNRCALPILNARLNPWSTG